MTDDPLPGSLRSTAVMLTRAYPQGLPPEDYRPLIALLHEEMSDRNLATVISKVFGNEYSVVWNDIGRVASIETTPEATIEGIRKKLLTHGYEDWLKER